MEVHIDWLSVSQRHSDAPEWGSTRRLDFNLETGDIEQNVVLGDTLEGSWSTSLRVRSSGGTVEVSGNPSKWGRLDAVVGLGTMQECIDLYNAELLKLGLPMFRPRTPGNWVPLEDGRLIEDGARISRVDLTRNLVSGGPEQARMFVQWAEGQRWGHRLRFERVAEGTTAAGNRRRRQRLFYLKWAEIWANRRKWCHSRRFDREVAKDYLQNLHDWAESIGLIRDEIRLGTQWLSESPWCWVDNWGSDTARRLFLEHDSIPALEAGTMTDYRSGVFDMMKANGVSDMKAARAQGIFQAWLNNGDWKLGLRKSAQYEYAGLLRKHCGVDVWRACNVSTMSRAVRPVVLECSPLSGLDLPPWYQRRAA